MKRSRFTEEQIIAILKEQEAGMNTDDVCRKHGISQPSFYKYKVKYGGMDVSDARRLRALEDENAKLKKLLAEQMLELPQLLAGKLGLARCVVGLQDARKKFLRLPFEGSHSVLSDALCAIVACLGWVGEKDIAQNVVKVDLWGHPRACVCRPTCWGHSRCRQAGSGGVHGCRGCSR